MTVQTALTAVQALTYAKRLGVRVLDRRDASGVVVLTVVGEEDVERVAFDNPTSLLTANPTPRVTVEVDGHPVRFEVAR